MKFLRESKLHLLCLGLVVVAEFIGIKRFEFGLVSFSLLPMLYALVLGIFLSRIPNLLSEEDMDSASSYIGISVMYLIAFSASAIGPNLSEVLSAGPALILQEFGNLGTLFFSIPVAVLLFKMDRTCVGSGFSTSRESSIAIVGSLYGLDSPEGRGVMGSYITGTLLGTIFCGMLASLMTNISWFSPESLAMAAGTGSASMMSASIAPVVEAFPDKADILMGFAATSQVLTNVDGIYMSLFISIPLSNWLYNKLKGKEAVEAELKELGRESDVDIRDIKIEEEDQVVGVNWPLVIRTLLISGAISVVAFKISAQVSGKDFSIMNVVPGMAWLFGITIAGNFVDHMARKVNIKLPTVLFIALISSVLSIPTLWPGAVHFNEAMKHISLLPICTPILAYAGMGTGKDLEAFKGQGFNIIIITLLALAGTYIGSAVIANIILKLMGQV